MLFAQTLRKIQVDSTSKVNDAVSQAASLARRRRVRHLRVLVWLAGFTLGGLVAAALAWYAISLSREER